MTDKFSGINTPVLSPLIRKPWWPVVTVSRDSLQDWAKVTPPPHGHCGLCLVLHHCLPPSFPCPRPHCRVGFSLEVFLIHDVQWILILRSVSRTQPKRSAPTSTPSETFTKALALTFILNTQGIVCATRNWVAFNSHIDSSHDLLFTTPLATHGCPKTDKEDTGLGELTKTGKEFFSAVSSESAEVFLIQEFWLKVPHDKVSILSPEV